MKFEFKKIVMLKRFIGSRNQLPENVQIPAVFPKAALTPKQWRRAMTIQKKIESLEQKLATLLGNPAKKSGTI